MSELMTGRSETSTIPTRALLRAFVALRIFFGLDWMSNALAKLVGIGTFHWGFTTFNLVDRDTARAILHQAAVSTSIRPLGAFYTNVVLANWNFFQWFQAVAELAIALGLLFGLATRLAAVGGLLMIGPVWITLLGTNQYLWTYPLDLFPLLLLAIVPVGRIAGLDSKLARRFNRHWPF